MAEHALHEGYFLLVGIDTKVLVTVRASLRGPEFGVIDSCAHFIKTGTDELKLMSEEAFKASGTIPTSASMLSELQISCRRAFGRRATRPQAQVGTAPR